MDIYLGDREIELLHFGVGHTRGDVVAYLPVARTLFAGDLVVVDRVPLVTDPTTTGWIAVLDRLAELSPERVVPGHGLVCGPAGIAFTRGYLVTLRAAVGECVEAGLSLEQAREEVRLTEYAGLPRFEQAHPLNVAVMYAELAGEGARLEIRDG